MVGLILWLAAWLPAPPPSTGGALSQNPHLERLQQLLAAPATEDQNWRRKVWQELRSLEHADQKVVAAGWKALATSGGDADLANWILYCRRHQRPLPAPQPSEGADPLLERALALWGESRLDQAEQALIEATKRFPTDSRLRDNLCWLRLQPPSRVDLDGDPRHLALVVLASRAPLP